VDIRKAKFCIFLVWSYLKIIEKHSNKGKRLDGPGPRSSAAWHRTEPTRPTCGDQFSLGTYLVHMGHWCTRCIY
jgi:hypothetical protein